MQYKVDFNAMQTHFATNSGKQDTNLTIVQVMVP